MSVKINTTQTSGVALNSSNVIGMTKFERFLQTWQAKIALFFGGRERAAEIHRQMLAKEPGNIYALNSLAYDALQKQNYVLSHQYFERVLMLAPELANSQFNVAYVASELGRLSEAENLFRAAIAIEEKMDRAWYGLGLVLVRLGRLDEAVVVFKLNTKLQPMSPFGWYQLARTHMELNQTQDAQTILRHLNGFEPKVAAQLARETGLKI